MASDRFVRVKSADLPFGKKVRRPILQIAGQVELLGAGSLITREFLDSLAKRGITAVLVHVIDRTTWATQQQEASPSRWIDFAKQRIQPVPNAVREYARELSRGKATGEAYEEKRQQPRYPVAVVLHVMPVNAAYVPTSEPFEAISRNVSSGGLSFVCTRAVNEKLLIVELKQEKPVQMVMQVVRCGRVGRFYEVAGPLLERLDPP